MRRGRIGEILFIIAACVLLAGMGTGWLIGKWQQEEADRIAWLEDGFYIDTLQFSVEGTGLDEGIRGWHDWVGGGTVYVFLPSYAAGRELSMEWRFADRLLIDGQRQRKGRSVSFVLDQEYEFLFQEKDEEERFTVVFLCSANLPAVFVTTESESMDFVEEDRLNREAGFFYLMGQDGSIDCEDRLTYIKGRGNTTWGQDKKPYSIKLSDKQDLLGMGAARRWELLANAYDGSHMRNQLVFELAQEAGLSYTPQGAWADLFLNGEYQGLYQITEKVEIAPNRVDIENQEAGKGDLTGGYLFLMEDYSRFENAASKFMTDGGQTLVIKNPEEAGEAQLGYLEGLVQEFEDAILAEDGINPETGRAFTEYIDLDSFAKKYLIEEITKNSDAVTNSQYFYKEPDAVSPLLFAGPVWDYDNALGHTNEEAMNPVGLMLDKVRSDSGSNLWYGALNSQPAFTARVRELYETVFADLLTDMTERKIDLYREQNRVSATLDWIRWKDTNKDFRYQVFDSYDAYVDYLQEFVRQRKSFLDSVFVEGEEYCRIRFMRGEPYGYVDFYVRKGDSGQNAPEDSDLERDGERITGWVYEDGTPYDPARPLEEDITVYAKWEEVQ